MSSGLEPRSKYDLKLCSNLGDAFMSSAVHFADGRVRLNQSCSNVGNDNRWNVLPAYKRRKSNSQKEFIVIICRLCLQCKLVKDAQLCYSNQHCNRIPEVIIKLYAERVYSLDLSYNDLITTRGLEQFQHLRELVLDNNQLSDNMNLPHLPHLHTLSLNKNMINDIELLLEKLCTSFPSLNFLSLLGNKACPNQLSDIANDEDDYTRYRFYVISQIPTLNFLDSTRVCSEERRLATIRGRFMRVVRPPREDASTSAGGNNSRSSTQDDSPTFYSPLPRTMRRPDDHKGAYSKCKYKYSGKHSEGNRFISNNDL